MMQAVTNDSRYQPGVEMIAAKRNLEARVRELEKQVDFYKMCWEGAMQEADRYKDLYTQELRSGYEYGCTGRAARPAPYQALQPRRPARRVWQ